MRRAGKRVGEVCALSRKTAFLVRKLLGFLLSEMAFHAWRSDLVRLIFVIAVLGVQSCVPSPSSGVGHGWDIPTIMASERKIWHGSSDAVWTGAFSVSMPCRLRGGANIPFRQGSTIEKEKQAASEVEAARYL